MPRPATYLHPIDRVSKRASDVAAELGLSRYDTGARCNPFSEAEVDAAAKKLISRIAA